MRGDEVKASTVIVIALVLYGIIGDIYFRSFFHTLWIVIGGLFFLFLIVYHRMDHKGMFLPKKKKKES